MPKAGCFTNISYDIFICMFGIQAKIQGNIKTIMLDRKLQQRVKKATLHLLLDFFTIQISVLNKTEKPLSI